MPPAKRVDPFTNINDINSMKEYFFKKKRIRDLTIFIIGINTGLYPTDLIHLKYCHVLNDDFSIKIEIDLSMFGRYRIKSVPINESVVSILNEYINYSKATNLDNYMFKSQRRNSLYSNSLNKIIKDATVTLALNGNFGSSSLRKTYLYHTLGICMHYYHDDEVNYKTINTNL